MKSDQDLTHIRGDDLQVAVTVTLDESRTLDGSETWKWVLKTNAEGHALLTKTSPASGVIVDDTSKQPTIVIEAGDFSGSSYPDSINDQSYVHELQMTKSSKIETVMRGSFTLVTDFAK